MKDIKKYPAPTGYYKVEVNNGCDWKSSHALRLGISVGGRNHAGDRFFALAEWAAARFESVTVLVADSLQRHNIMFQDNLGAAEAMTRALAAGEAWILENRDALKLLPNCKIVRLEEIKKDPGFFETHVFLQELFEKDVQFKQLVDKDIKAIWARKIKANGPVDFNFEAFYAASKNYLLEELALMDCVDAAYPGVEVYPGSFLQVLTSPERHGIKGLPERLRHYPLVEVDFVRNRSYKMPLSA